MNIPATTCPTAVPNSVTWPSTLPSWLALVIAVCTRSMTSLIWLSLAWRGPVFNQSLISPRPWTVWSARSWAPLATCAPAKTSPAVITEIPAITISREDRTRPSPIRPSTATRGAQSAEISSATISGMTTTLR